MDIYLRVRKLLAASIGISEELVTLDTTLGALWGHRQGTSPNEPVSLPGTPFGEISPDSLDMVEFIMLLEELGIEIPDVAAGRIPSLFFDPKTTVLQIVEFIDRHSTE